MPLKWSINPSIASSIVNWAISPKQNSDVDDNLLFSLACFTIPCCCQQVFPKEEACASKVVCFLTQRGNNSWTLWHYPYRIHLLSLLI